MSTEIRCDYCGKIFELDKFDEFEVLACETAIKTKAFFEVDYHDICLKCARKFVRKYHVIKVYRKWLKDRGHNNINL